MISTCSSLTDFLWSCILTSFLCLFEKNSKQGQKSQEKNVEQRHLKVVKTFTAKEATSYMGTYATTKTYLYIYTYIYAVFIHKYIEKCCLVSQKKYLCGDLDIQYYWYCSPQVAVVHLKYRCRPGDNAQDMRLYDMVSTLVRKVNPMKRKKKKRKLKSLFGCESLCHPRSYHRSPH